MHEPHDNPGDAAGNSRKTAGRPWSKGVSGNPFGRPRKTAEAREVEALARASSADAFETVRALMVGSENDRVRLAAALAIIERAHGKPGDTLAEPVGFTEGATLAEQAQAVMQAALAGRIATMQANALLSGLASVARIVELAELEGRMAALEAIAGKGA